jgi:hypothetical protein
VKYWAFVSYSHKDTAIADWLHKKLETYRVPRSLIGTPSREGAVPNRLVPIFRDRDELPTSSELGDNLQRSLQQSRYLIVICSPAAAQSRWVEEEVRAFKGWNGRDRIIALVADGIPNATDRAKPEQECFPHSMRFDVEGSKAPVRVEPIAADLRSEGDGKHRAFLKIVAGILGVGFDDLYQREKRRANRRKLLAGAVAVLVLIAVVGIYASIARLGLSQKRIQTELSNVGTGSKVATTNFKDLRPANKEAETRIRFAADNASAAIDAVDAARLANKPDDELNRTVLAAQNAVLAVTGNAATLEEQLFAAELVKPLWTKHMAASKAVSDEVQHRWKERARLTEEKIRREVEERKKKK